MKRREPKNPIMADAFKAAGLADDATDRTGHANEGLSNQAGTVDNNRASAALDYAHSILSTLSPSDNYGVENFVRLAAEVGRHGGCINARVDEKSIVAAAIDKIEDLLLTRVVGQLEQYDLLLALAALSGGPNTKQKIRSRSAKILAEAIFNGHLPSDFQAAICRGAKQRRLLKKGIHLPDVEHRIQQLRDEAEHKKREERRRIAKAQEARERVVSQVKEQIASAKVKLTRVPRSPEVEIENISEDDRLLLLAWADKGNAIDEIPTDQSLADRLGRWDFTRLWSARTAELATRCFYEDLGAKVEDVAAHQLFSGYTDWHTHDLRVDGRAIDVKNARQSFSDPSRYSEYLVPRFKTERSVGNSVSIAAVLSRYQPAEAILDGASAQCTVLGEVNEGQLKQLQSWFTTEYGEYLAIAPLDSSNRLPGWCFDYTWDRTASLSEAKDALADALAMIRTHGITLQEASVPPWLLLATGWTDQENYGEEGVTEAPLTSNDTAMKEALLSMRDAIGFSRRSIFLFVLAYTLMQIKENRWEWSPRDLKPWLFDNKSRSDRRWPVGLCDPLGYVAGIVDAMDLLWRRSSRDLLSSFSDFRLTSPWILKGKQLGGAEFTLLAYCGGWIETGKGAATKCGYTPLVLGDNASCPHCGRLICNHCGFCSEDCARRKTRR